MKKKPKVYPNWMWPFYTLRKLKGRDQKHEHGENETEQDGTCQICIVDENGIDSLSRINHDQDLVQNVAKIDSQFYG